MPHKLVLTLAERFHPVLSGLLHKAAREFLGHGDLAILEEGELKRIQDRNCRYLLSEPWKSHTVMSSGLHW